MHSDDKPSDERLSQPAELKTKREGTCYMKVRQSQLL